MSTSLIPIEKVNAIELFTKDGELDSLLKRIEKDALSIVPDLETTAGRKKIASDARNVAKSKGVIEKAGKELVSEWKNQAKVVDIRRKTSRDFLDGVRDRVRQPLTDWEAKEQRESVARLRALELIEAETEAHAENEIFAREQAIKVRETELARQEEERQRLVAEEIQRRAKLEMEEKIRAEAQEQAKREAAEAIQVERERAKQAERDKIEADEKAEREVAEAVERAERGMREAVEQERRRTEALAAEEKREAAARAADRENRRKVNTKIVAAFKAEDIDGKTAQSIVRLVASGGIPHMTIRY